MADKDPGAARPEAEEAVTWRGTTVAWALSGGCEPGTGAERWGLVTGWVCGARGGRRVRLGDELGQMLVPFTELPKARGEQTRRGDEGFPITIRCAGTTLVGTLRPTTLVSLSLRTGSHTRRGR